MEKGHYGEYSGNAKHSRVTASNYKASERDDAAHIDYLKRDVLYDDHHSHSDAAMTADEKHISKLAGDMRYDKKHHGMSRESAELKYMPIEDDMKRGMSRKGSKPDYIDIDGDGNKTESMKEASDGMSRRSRSERLRGRAVKLSERSGEGQGGYDYENPRVMNMLNKANMLDERSGAEMKMMMTKHMTAKPKMKANEYDNENRDKEMNRMMDERGGMNRMSKYGGNMHDYHRHMDAQGHMTKDGVVGGGKYGKGGHYKDYEGMSRESYGMERKSCGTKYTGPSRYSSPAAFMGIKRPGRCTPFPNPDCEPGTPQYNLAKRLKPGGDLYKGKKK
jgi:hypothetical protein